MDDDGTRVRVVCGSFWGKRGPVDGIAADPNYLDMAVPPGRRKTLPVDTRRNAFAHVFEGSGDFRHASAPFGVLTDRPGPVETVVREQTGNRSLVLFDGGDEVIVGASVLPSDARSWGTAERQRASRGRPGPRSCGQRGISTRKG